MRKKYIWLACFFCLPILLLSVETGYNKPFEIYISTSGKDANNGLTEKTTIFSMHRAQMIAKSALRKHHRNLIVHINSGVYKRQHTRWNFSMEDKNITFLGKNTSKPIFDGEGINATWLRIDYTNHSTKTNIHIRNIQIENYARAIYFHGNKITTTKKVDYNSVKNCIFKNIGDKYSSAKVGYAAISVMNSSFNLFEDNQFINIENNKSMCKIKKKKRKCFNTDTLIHALYMSYNSSFNYIKNNLFQNISGDAIKTRASSNFNTIEGNIFKNIRRMYQDWYAHYVNVIDEDIIECESWGNTFFKNTIGNKYHARKKAQKTDLKIKFYKNSGQKEYCNKQKMYMKIPRVYIGN